MRPVVVRTPGRVGPGSIDALVAHWHPRPGGSRVAACAWCMPVTLRAHVGGGGCAARMGGPSAGCSGVMPCIRCMPLGQGGHGGGARHGRGAGMAAVAAARRHGRGGRSAAAWPRWPQRGGMAAGAAARRHGRGGRSATGGTARPASRARPRGHIAAAGPRRAGGTARPGSRARPAGPTARLVAGDMPRAAWRGQWGPGPRQGRGARHGHGAHARRSPSSCGASESRGRAPWGGGGA